MGGAPAGGHPGTPYGGPQPGQFPPGQFPPGQYPPGQGQGPGQYAPGPYEPGQPAQGAYPPGQFPPGAFPPGAPGQFPPGAYQQYQQPGTYQQGVYQQGPYEQGPYQQGPYQQGQYPPGQPGQGQWAPGAGNAPNWVAHGPGQPGPGYPAPGRPGPGYPQPGPPPQGQPWPGAQPGTAYPAGAGAETWERAGVPVIRQRDSALPDATSGAKGAPIASIEMDNVAAFARDLRVLRSKAGLDYPDMAEKSHYTMRTLASAAGGLRLPTLPVLIAYVKACGGDVSDWEERWGRLIRSGKKGPTALPAGSGDADGPGSVSAAGPAGGVDGRPALGTAPIPPNSTTVNEVYVITSAKPRDDRW